MKNIETAIFPLIFVLCICGLCVFEYPQGRPRLYFTIFYILISWPLHVYLYVQAKTFLVTYGVKFSSVYYSTVVMVPIFMVLNIYYYKRFKSCLKKLDIVNDTLEELGMLKNHAQLRVKTIWLIIGWITSILVMNIVESITVITQIPKSYTTISIYMLIIDHSVHIGTLYEITFLFLLRYIGTLFEHVNQCIQILIEQKKRQVRPWTTYTSSSIMHRHLRNTSQSNQFICLLMHIYLELSSISRELSTVFGLQMVLQIAEFHLTALAFIFDLYNFAILLKTQFTYETAMDFLCIFIWCVRCILDIIVFGYICEAVCKKANRVETLLNRLANITFDVETQENIMQFLLEIIRRPLRISGLGLYNYDYKLVHKFIERSMKMIIIVIQAR